MRKVELLPTRDCEAGYGPAFEISFSGVPLTKIMPQIVNLGVNFLKISFLFIQPRIAIDLLLHVI